MTHVVIFSNIKVAGGIDLILTKAEKKSTNQNTIPIQETIAKAMMMIMTGIELTMTGVETADERRGTTFLATVLRVDMTLQNVWFTKILHYPLFQEMESHSLQLMLIILLTVERGIRNASAKEIETGTGVLVVIGTANDTGTRTEMIVIVIVLKGQMTFITTNHVGGIMNEKATTSIEGMISPANLEMNMNTVLGIVIVTGTGTGTQSVIGIRNPDQTETETETGTGIETEARKEETGKGNEETGKGNGGKGNGGKGNEGTGSGGTGSEGTGSEGTGNEGTGIEETERKAETERNHFDHKPHRLVSSHLLRLHQLVILLDPSSKKCLPLTLIAMVLCLRLQRQALDHLSRVD